MAAQVEAQPTERFITTSFGTTLSVRIWASAAVAPTATPPLQILALHGWMDNSASFSFLAPLLLPLLPPGSVLAAPEFAGHGHSSHSPAGLYNTAEHSLSCLAVADGLGFDRFVLLGHSMGGGVAVVLAGAFPERVRGVACLDSAGPPLLSAAAAPDSLAKCLSARQAAVAAAARLPSGAAARGQYAAVETAVAARLATVAGHPGAQTLSRESATALVERALCEAPGGGFSWRHDSRIKAPSPFSYCEEQVGEFLRRLAGASIPVLLVRARQGWPYDAPALAGRLGLLKEVLRYEELPGSHHFHMDGATRGAVVEALARWCKEVVCVA